MAMQIVTTVDKKSVEFLKARLCGYINLANEVKPDATFVAIRDVEENLHKAQAIHESLTVLDLLDDLPVTAEDLDRTKNRLADIPEEKRRKDIPRWKGGNT